MIKNRVELLAPSGDLDRLKTALLYGADAVYIGGKTLSLRSAANNFTLDDIKEGVEFAHKLNKKVYVTCNMVLHEEDKVDVLSYLTALKKAGVDGIITSSLYLIELNKDVGLEIHISTQLSTLNSLAVSAYKDMGATRVVLGRELDINEIKDICDKSEVEIEVFIHGGMCSSYSGKCMLSNIMTDRDANRGGCAHSCRWKYYLYDDNHPIFSEENYFSMSSKDLCLIREIPALIDAGVASLKIEGRMKSLNYLAFIVSSYRKCIDDYYNNQTLDFDKYMSLINFAENRLTGHGFIKGNVTIEEMLYNLDHDFSKAGNFIGIVRKVEGEYAYLEVKNKIIKNNTYYVLSPNKDIEPIKIKEMSHENIDVEVYTIAGHLLKLKCDKKLQEYDIIHVIE